MGSPLQDLVGSCNERLQSPNCLVELNGSFLVVRAAAIGIAWPLISDPAETLGASLANFRNAEADIQRRENRALVGSSH